MDSATARLLQSGCDALRLDLNQSQLRQLEEFLQLLVKWNRAYNLTAVRDPAAMVTRHLLDSLAVTPYIAAQRSIDVGSGAGLPGVPLAIALPDRTFHLLDSNGKKTRFLFQVKTALGLDNMDIHHARVESFTTDRRYDVVLSRAFASLVDMVQGCRHLLAEGGRFLAMKGASPEAELAAVARECEIVAIHPLAVPGLAEQRHLVELVPRPGRAP